MSNNQLYPFQRNRYYLGKLLTSADFQAEQDYFRNRSYFMNSLMYGSGVICGLGVVSLDDLSILIESGAAIDGLGREIVQENSLVRKLSAIEGYDQITSDKVCLCLRYEETPVHSVYAVGKENLEQNFEYSRMDEGCHLFVMDLEQAEQFYDMETEFFAENTIYRDEDYEVKIKLPSVVSRRKPVRISVCIQKLSENVTKLSVHCELQLPGFVNTDGEPKLNVAFDDVSLKEDEKIIKDYWVTAGDGEEEYTPILLKSGAAFAYKNDEAVAISSDFELRVLLSDLHPREIVNHEIGRMNLEMRDLGGMADYVRLAVINLVRAGDSYIIDKISEDIRTYVAPPSQQLLREAYLDYYIKQTDINTASVLQREVVNTQKSANISNSSLPYEVASGVLEIPLGSNARRGNICYSGEIIHGLGEGDVYVSVGFESIAEDSALGVNARSTIYGDASLFQSDKVPVPNVETAVKVLNDKGSFVVAAKLLDNVDFLVLTYRWVAIRFPSSDNLGAPEDYKGSSIIPETPTVVLETKESHYFGVRFENMDSCSLVYELTEEGSGEITAEGVYTAPAKEGVYEIRIYCADMPIICAYAYAIVKKRGLEEAVSTSKGNLIDDIRI